MTKNNFLDPDPDYPQKPNQLFISHNTPTFAGNFLSTVIQLTDGQISQKKYMSSSVAEIMSVKLWLIHLW